MLLKQIRNDTVDFELKCPLFSNLGKEKLD